MAQINSGVNNRRILKIVRAPLDQQDLQIRVRLRQSTSCYTGGCSPSGKNNVDFADGVIVGGHFAN
jgi:hypothetical protein